MNSNGFQISLASCSVAKAQRAQKMARQQILILRGTVIAQLILMSNSSMSTRLGIVKKCRAIAKNREARLLTLAHVGLSLNQAITNVISKIPFKPDVPSERDILRRSGGSALGAMAAPQKPPIRPYPSQYAALWTLRNKKDVLIRPIRPEDEPLLAKFHQTLSAETVYNRYFNTLQLSERVAHERLLRICFNDYDREIALVTEYRPGAQSNPEILGVGRLSKLRGDQDAEFALVISDAWQRQGLGAEMLKRLIDIGKREKIRRIIGHILPENHAMQHVCRKAGFKVEHDAEGHDFIAAFSVS
jgi:RimJ/RimL family protein N-acetyltransferase